MCLFFYGGRGGGGEGSTPEYSPPVQGIPEDMTGEQPQDTTGGSRSGKWVGK